MPPATRTGTLAWAARAVAVLPTMTLAGPARLGQTTGSASASDAEGRLPGLPCGHTKARALCPAAFRAEGPAARGDEAAPLTAALQGHPTVLDVDVEPVRGHEQVAEEDVLGLPTTGRALTRRLASSLTSSLYEVPSGAQATSLVITSWTLCRTSPSCHPG
jgi:hypothetical protein